MFKSGSFKRLFHVLVPIFLIMPAFSLASTTIEVYKNTEVKKISPQVDGFLYQVLKEYPYLYVNQKETNYNSIFEKDPKAFVILAKKHGKVVGALQANPLDSRYFKNQAYSPEKFLEHIKKNGYSLNKILYISTFMLSKDERSNSDLINQMFDKTTDMAKKLGDSQICYMEILEAKNHPLRPNSYVPPEPWGKLGKNIKNMNVESTMSWPTLQADGKVKNESHKMAFYVIDL